MEPSTYQETIKKSKWNRSLDALGRVLGRLTRRGEYDGNDDEDNPFESQEDDDEDVEAAKLFKRTYLKSFAGPTGPIEVEDLDQIVWNAVSWPIYLKCPINSDIYNLIQVVKKAWMLRRSQIILMILSDFAPLDKWDDLQAKSFQKGLIKAATASKMWIVTNGIGVGASKLVVDAIDKEKKWQKGIQGEVASMSNPIMKSICIGVVREDRITSDPLMQRYLRNIEKLNETNPIHQGTDKFKEGKFYIDEHHSHFIFVLKEYDTDLEQLLALDLFCELSREESWFPDEPMDWEKKQMLKTSHKTPVITMLIQGDYYTPEVVLEYLSKQSPIVVLQGSGGFADLLSYTFKELEERTKQEGIPDPDYVDNILKPALSKMIWRLFPDMRINKDRLEVFRDRTIECAKNGTQENYQYLTVVDIDNDSTDLANFDKYLLQAYFKTNKAPESGIVVKPQEQFTADLHLALGWNCPEIAKNTILRRLEKERVSIANEIFLRALIEPNREEFIDVLLGAGFQVRQLFNYKTLKWLMIQASTNDFFLTVCCEGILGILITSGFPVDFFQSYLNNLIALTSGFEKFLKHDELTNRYKLMPSCIEQKSLTFIAIWAVFTNRTKVVESIWPHHIQPIHLTLLISTIYKKMSNYVTDISLKKQILELNVKYGVVATRLLEECSDKADPWRTKDILSYKSPHWSWQSACDVAAAAELHDFISHESCQKWLIYKFMNDMHIQKLPFLDFLVPQAIKIILCAFLIFPTCFWLDFPEHVGALRRKVVLKIRKRRRMEQQMKIFGSKESLFSVRSVGGEHKMVQQLEPGSRALEAEVKKVAQPDVTGSVEGKLVGSNVNEDKKFQMKEDELRKKGDIPSTGVDITVLEKLTILWSAPITKYWIFFIFHCIFLTLFSYAVMLHSCGSQKVDLCVFIWISLKVIEDIRRTYVILKHHKAVQMSNKFVEIPCMIVFLFLFYLGRIIRFDFVARRPFFVKMLMASALLHYYYMFLAIYFPISSTLGPLFYRMKLMILNDFFHFMIICAPIMIGSAIVIEASLYSDRPFHAKSFHEAFHRTFYSLFKTFDQELRIPAEDMYTYCKSSKGVGIENICQHSNYNNNLCYNSTIWTYIFDILFVVMLKLILLTLLYALFNAKALTLDANTIWRYQRYQLISDFDLHLPIPPPFNIFCYLFLAVRHIWVNVCCACCFTKTSEKFRNSIREDVYECKDCPDESMALFWREICQSCLKKQTKEEFKTKPNF